MEDNPVHHLTSELDSPERKRGRPPKKKPRPSGSQSLRDEKRLNEAEELETARKQLREEARLREEEELRRREEDAAAEVTRKLSSVFKQVEESGFSSFFAFLDEAFHSSDRGISSRMGKLVKDRGDEIFSLLAERNPDITTKWAHSWMKDVYESESKALWKAFRPSSTSKLNLIDTFSLEEMMAIINEKAPYLVDLLVAIGSPAQLGTTPDTSEKRRRDSRLVCGMFHTVQWPGR